MSNTNVLETVRSNDFIVVDNHDNRLRRIEAVCELVNGKFAPLLKAQHQCLNELYLGEDGYPHLSTCSIAGVVRSTNFSEHNESVLFSRMQIKTVFWKDGHVEEVKLFDKDM